MSNDLLVMAVLVSSCAAKPNLPPPTNGPIRVAAIQAASQHGDPAGNRAKLQNLTRKAASQGARIVVLPEAAVTGYLTADLETTWRVRDASLGEDLVGADPRGVAETVPGPSTTEFARLAAELGIYITVPLVEVDRKTGRYYNTSVLVGPEGQILIHYRKRDPWPWAEQSWATPGDRGNPVVDTPLGRLGLLICYDIHDQAEVMGQLKVDLLLYSIAWVDDEGSSWYDHELPAIAALNSLNIVAANWTVRSKPDWFGFGQSRIIAADGTILARAHNDLADEIVLAELASMQQMPITR